MIRETVIRSVYRWRGRRFVVRRTVWVWSAVTAVPPDRFWFTGGLDPLYWAPLDYVWIGLDWGRCTELEARIRVDDAGALHVEQVELRGTP